jgi:cell division transport system permease protein
MNERAAVTRAERLPQPARRRPRPIVPRGSVAGSSLIALVAIMTFLAAVTVGAVEIVRGAARDWQADVAREITIQVRPVAGRDFEAEIGKAVEIARRTRGVAEARAYSREEAGRLLEPWLGGGIDLRELPIPRLIVVRLGEEQLDLAALRRALAQGVAGATLDDHRDWARRLAALSDVVLSAGVAVLALVLLTTVLSVSFATRGAVAANRAVVEVLHLVGARESFIVRAFQRHFLLMGLYGAALGAAAAALLYLLAGAAPDVLAAAPGGGDAALFLGRMRLESHGYWAIAAVGLLMAVVAVVASRRVVRRTLRAID